MAKPARGTAPAADRIDEVVAEWAAQRPDLRVDALAIVLRIQALAKALADQVATDLGAFDLEWWGYDALAVLRRSGKPFRMASTDIAAEAALSAGAMTHRIDRLEQRGLVERIEDASDRRRVLVQLTRKGRKLIDRATEARFASAEAAMGDLSPRRREQLAGLLRQLMRHHEG